MVLFLISLTLIKYMVSMSMIVSLISLEFSSCILFYYISSSVNSLSELLFLSMILTILVCESIVGITLVMSSLSTSEWSMSSYSVALFSE